MNKIDYNQINSYTLETEILYKYSTVFYVPIGFVLNSLSIIIFNRKSLRKHHYSCLCSILIITDTISLFWSFMFYKYFPNIGIDISSISSSWCTCFVFISRINHHIPSIIQIYISFDRLITVYYPNKIKYLKSKRNICISLIIIYLFVFIINMGNILERKIEITENKNNKSEISCKTDEGSLEFANDLISAFTRVVLPFLIIFVVNLLIIKKMFSSNKRLNTQKKLSKGSDHFKFSITALNLIFFVFNLPLLITYVIYYCYKYRYRSLETNSTLSKVKFIHQISTVIAFSYHVFPFFVNLVFNNLFRKEVFFFINFFKQHFNKILTKPPRSKVKPISKISNKTDTSLNSKN